MSTSIIDPVELTQSLISCPSVTPTDAGVLQVLQDRLEKIVQSAMKQSLKFVVPKLNESVKFSREGPHGMILHQF